LNTDWLAKVRKKVFSPQALDPSGDEEEEMDECPSGDEGMKGMNALRAGRGGMPLHTFPPLSPFLLKTTFFLHIQTFSLPLHLFSITFSF
jgi:hypothetical protein